MHVSHSVCSYLKFCLVEVYVCCASFCFKKDFDKQRFLHVSDIQICVKVMKDVDIMDQLEIFVGLIVWAC
jgi:hypothetical protein